MLKIQLICLLLCYFVRGKDLGIIVKLDATQILDALTSQSSVKYLTQLAGIIAKKAAQSFIKEIKNNENVIKKDTKFLNKERTNRVHKSKYVQEHLLNEEKAIKLLNEPLPDGDDIGWHSRELSEEDYAEKNTVQVYGLTKVNGIYARRLLGLAE